jgi:hypothetical protein
VKLRPDYIQQEIAALLIAHPELEEDEILRADSIEGETSAFEFLSKIIRMIGAAQSLTSGTADYIAELQERKARMERREAGLRSLIFKVMNTADLKKVELPEATLSIRAGQQKVVIVNERELPTEFFRLPPPEPDKNLIKAALKSGETILGAVLSNAEPTLAIRVK